MTSFRMAAAIVAALLVSACLPVTTKTPVGTTAGIAPDPALYGVWKGAGKDNDGPGYLSFLRNDDGSMTAILYSPPSGSDGGDWEVFGLKTAVLAGRHYMTATEMYTREEATGETKDELGPILLFYLVEHGNTLTLYLADENKAAALVKAGKLRGTISGDESSPDVVITSDGPELDKFFASPEAASLFTKPMVVMTKQP